MNRGKDAGTPEKTVVLSAWNDGGCEGKLEIKAVLEDALTEDTSFPASVCLSPIVSICEDVVVGNGGPPFDPATVTESPDDSASSHNGMWQGIALAVAGVAAVLIA